MRFRFCPPSRHAAAAVIPIPAGSRSLLCVRGLFQVCRLCLFLRHINFDRAAADQLHSFLHSDVFLHLKSTWFKDSPAFKELSMGMSHDYHLALRHHTTMVRIGTRIFGERVY